MPRGYVGPPPPATGKPPWPFAFTDHRWTCRTIRILAFTAVRLGWVWSRPVCRGAAISTGNKLAPHARN